MKLSELKGIGPASEKQLNDIGIHTRKQLENTGAVNAFIKLREAGVNPSLNFLYAMVGGLADKHWAEVSRTDRQRLLTELEGHRELQALIENQIRNTVQ